MKVIPKVGMSYNQATGLLLKSATVVFWRPIER